MTPRNYRGKEANTCQFHIFSVPVLHFYYLFSPSLEECSPTLNIITMPNKFLGTELRDISYLRCSLAFCDELLLWRSEESQNLPKSRDIICGWPLAG